MIARMWHGSVPAEKSEQYHSYLLKTGLHDYEQINGNRGVFLMKNDEGAVTHYYTLTFWDDWTAIKKFAGEDFEKARYYPEDPDFLLELEEKVKHFEIVEKPDYLHD